jgi:hypothetical protein
MMLPLLLLVLQDAARAPAPGLRAHHWLVYDAGAKSVALMGGSTPVGNGFTFYDDWWSFDGAGWTLVRRTGRPLSGERVVWFPEGECLVAFGGFTPQSRSLGELREWIEEGWSTLDPAADKAVAEAGGPGPPARSSHGMVYDERRGKVVLFGGTAGSGPLGDTWEFDGTRWSRFEGAAPPPRLAPGMAYDSKRGRTLLFGGGGAGKMLGDTWSFDGKAWSELAAPGPSARVSPAMAYDPGRDRVVLFGGRRSWPDDLADTWLFDGERWSEVGAR